MQVMEAGDVIKNDKVVGVRVWVESFVCDRHAGKQ